MRQKLKNIQLFLTRNKKTLDVLTHVFLGVAGGDLMSSGYRISEEQGLIKGVGKSITGAFNIARNAWQAWLLGRSSSNNRNKNQVVSNTASAATNIPQFIGGFLSGKFADVAAAGLVTGMYALRARNYYKEAKTTLTQKYNATILPQMVAKYRHKIPGVIMAARGTVQGIEDPLAGSIYLGVGLTMLFTDANGTNGTSHHAQSAHSTAEWDVHSQDINLEKPKAALQIAL